MFNSVTGRDGKESERDGERAQLARHEKTPASLYTYFRALFRCLAHPVKVDQLVCGVKG